MMTRRSSFAFLAGLGVLLSIILSVAHAETAVEKNNDLISQVIAPADDSQEDSKEKRSREEIMFGNQQNKPNGLVDDMMGMAEPDDDSLVSSVLVPEKKDENITNGDDSSLKAPKDKEDTEEKRTPDHEDNEGDTMQNSDGVNWYNSNQQVSPSAMQYLVSSNPSMQRMPSEDNYNGLYDQEDLYRRKRQLLGHPVPLHKRSLRSPIGQMIQTRGRRLPRRSMRLKRQVDVEDLLSLLGDLESDKGRYYDQQQQVPERVNGLGYPDTPEYGYPYSYIRRVELPEPDSLDNNIDSGMDDDVDSLLLMPPNSRYVEGPDLGIPYRSREGENAAIQKWLSKHTTPSVFSVARRSAPFFYPIDYRYVPGYKKRSRLGNPNSHRMGEDDEEMGKWGQVVAMPEAYASAEDVARLYALANLMAEGEEEPQMKMRRSA